MTTAPSQQVSCSLSAAQLKEQRAALIPGLLERADRVTDLVDGLRLDFAQRAGLLPELARLIEAEQRCCSFLRFQLLVEPSAGGVSFEITGPEGTREMLRAL
ncbi:hypothetical protein [Chondromyces crocatus]|uniref:Uncharacterized protein n=1 Tax=Chondromyces crocatus TaxID=52 RepID=A0A0K1EFK4_CHOCO|nr:hypothetical protein [Chondromyces crocatus]AKT39368.1 uncharacterized protein CMC5_035150 [Chondromyces crocatus]